IAGMNIYNPTLKTWDSRPIVTGEDGKTLVVFGGRTSILQPNIFTGSIHILDITTGIWTSGLPDAAAPRIYAGCVLVVDQFVVWAG
ncbi:hypothetical protein BGZ97_010229, partial [Linnemannia gamsii]